MTIVSLMSDAVWDNVGVVWVCTCRYAWLYMYVFVYQEKEEVVC